MESKKINQLATELAPELSDLTIIGDPTTGISKKITLSQMASLFTGTVEEYANLASFPLVGTADTIYIALDTNIIYRWNTGTSAYVELSPNIVTSLVFSDANGFDGNISLVGSTATLTITTALTTGSVPFIGASGALSQDNANLFFDDTNNRLGINTNTPTTALDVFGSGIIERLNGTSTNNAFLGFASAGSNKWSIGNVQSDHRFRIYNEATTSELVSVLQTGEFGIGIANPLTKLHIFGGASALIANLDANTSVAKSISFRSGNSSRINLEVSGTESGSNAGADFFIRRYSDAGALIDTPLTITRSTGNTTFLNNVGIGIAPTVTASITELAIGSLATNPRISGIRDGVNAFSIYSASTGTDILERRNLDLRLGANNTTNLTLASTGNIGIATSSPNIGGYGSNSRVLTIQGVSGSYGILELTSNSANADGSAIGRLDFGSDGQAAGYKAISSIASFLSGSTSTKFGADLRFYTRANNAGSGDPVERLRIDSVGSVGIGTIQPTTTTFSHLFIGRNISMFSGSSTDIYIGSNFYYDGGFKVRYSEASAMINTNAGSIIFQNSSSGTAGGTFNGIERMRIGNNGCVGIGINNPTLLLQMQANSTIGNARVYAVGFNNTNYATFEVEAQGQFTGSFVANPSASTTYNGIPTSTIGITTSSTALVFATSNIERARITTGGNVGIGLTNPARKLDVFADGIKLGDGGSFLFDMNVGGSSAYFINFGIGASNYFRIRGDGAHFLSSFTYNNTVSGGTRNLFIDNSFALGGISSIRASKKNIQEFDSNWIYDLKPVQFNYRKKDEEGNYTEEIYEEINYGLIAEDTAPIADFLINYNDKEDGSKEMIGIEYMRLITPMLKEIQELKKEIELLKAK